MTEIYRSLAYGARFYSSHRKAFFDYLMSNDKDLELTPLEIRAAVRDCLDNHQIWRKRLDRIKLASVGYLYHQREKMVEGLCRPVYSSDGDMTEEEELLDEAAAILSAADCNGMRETKETLLKVRQALR